MGCCQSSASASPPSRAAVSSKAKAMSKARGTSTKDEVTTRTTSSTQSSGTSSHNGHLHKQQHKPMGFFDRLPPKPDGSKRNEIGKHLLKERKRDFRDYYDIVEQIGKGSISNIYLVRKKEGEGAASPTESTTATDRKDLYALKEIDVSLLEPEYEKEMRNEIQLMRVLDHPNIERIYEVYQHPTTGFLSIIMDYCSGGDLYARLPYTESQAQAVVWCLCEALNYMHTPNPDVVIHRDIKFGNIMFESTAKDAQIKLIDFGLSTKYGRKKLDAAVGSIYTMAPEVIRSEGYDTMADMWSVGAVTYELLAGTPPFWAENGNPKDVAKLVVRGRYNFDGPEWQSISADAKNFITKLLQLGPRMRMSARKALQHPWLASLAFTQKEDVDFDFIGQCYDNAEQYASSSDFHKLALQAVARSMTTDDVAQLRRAFHQFDSENTGTISYREMMHLLGDRYPTKDIKELFSRIDVDNNGQVNYTEFLAATMGVNGEITEARIREAFDLFDTDDSGYISRDDLRQILGKNTTESYIELLLEEADQDRNGNISFEEFKFLFRSKHREEAMKGFQADY